MDIKIFKTEFDVIFLERLSDFVSNAKTRFNNPYIADSIDQVLAIAANGKRIRPYNVAIAYEAYSDDSWKSITDLLIGIELIHVMALVHDDIMDNADTRHGVQTIHEFTRSKIDSSHSDSSSDHISRSQAILVGDMVFGWAYKSISKKDLSQECWNIVHDLVEEVVVGQMIDVITPLEDISTRESVEKKMLLKTARYTFSRPLSLGSIYASPLDKDIFWLGEFGDALGLMFQAQDDLLDITSSVSLLKKNTLGDIKNGVHTLLSVYVFENGTTEEREVWSQWFGKNIELDSVVVNEFLKKIGAIDYVENYISSQREKAVKLLTDSNISDAHKDNFRKIIEMLSHRKY